MVASSPPPAKKTRGLFCPRCQGSALPIVKTHLPCPGSRIRYRVCSKCSCRIVTGERILRWSYPLPTDAKATLEKLKKGCP